MEPKRPEVRASSSERGGLDERELVGRRHLHQPEVALDDGDAAPVRSTREAQSVAPAEIAFEGAPEGGCEKRLRRLRDDEVGAIDGLGDRVLVNALDRVGDGRHGTAPSNPRPSGSSTRSTTASSTRGRAAS